MRPRRAAVRDRRPRAGGRVQLADPARRAARGERARGRQGRDDRATTRPAGAACRRSRSAGSSLAGRYVGLHRPPGVRQRARDRRGPDGAYVDGDLDQVEIFYNGYISPLTQEVRRETLLPLQHATILEESDEDEDEDDGPPRAGRVRARPRADPAPADPRLRRDLGVPRAARVDGVRARRAHDRDAQRLRQRRRADREPDLQMNRARQAEITQEIMEVVAGRRGARLDPQRSELEAATQTQERGPHRGDPGRRDRGRVPRQAARDQPRDHGRSRRRQGMLVCEVQQHLGDDRVRAVAMDTTDGLARGTEVLDTGGPITVPGRRGDARAHLQPAGRADRPRRPGRDRGALADPPRRARTSRT